MSENIKNTTNDKKEVLIKLNTLEDVKNFVSIACMYDFDIDLSTGRYIVDAKSIMGIFSLDLTKTIKLTAHTDKDTNLFDKIEKYTVSED